MFDTVEKCYQNIKKIQDEARGVGGAVDPSTDEASMPRLPMIILRTPKGWTGIKKLRGEKIEGNCLSHQVVGPNVKTDRSELSALNKWLASYKFGELFSPESGFVDEIKNLVPPVGL